MNRTIIEWMKFELTKQFEMEGLGEAEVCLGLKTQCSCESRKIWLLLLQITYHPKKLIILGIDVWRPVDTPKKDCKDLETTETGCAMNVRCASSFPYLEDIGTLTYLIIGTRPDFALPLESWRSSSKILLQFTGMLWRQF